MFGMFPYNSLSSSLNPSRSSSPDFPGSSSRPATPDLSRHVSNLSNPPGLHTSDQPAPGPSTYELNSREFTFVSSANLQICKEELDRQVFVEEKIEKTDRLIRAACDLVMHYGCTKNGSSKIVESVECYLSDPNIVRRLRSSECNSLQELHKALRDHDWDWEHTIPILQQRLWRMESLSDKIELVNAICQQNNLDDLRFLEPFVARIWPDGAPKLELGSIHMETYTPDLQITTAVDCLSGGIMALDKRPASVYERKKNWIAVGALVMVAVLWVFAILLAKGMFSPRLPYDIAAYTAAGSLVLSLAPALLFASRWYDDRQPNQPLTNG